ncbi:MAG: GAF domain-containing protein, partial [Lentisphaerae bacterium]|nr:GAF domain-containing protein [Lentisphaerota bacterium]MBT5604359.1 GAF domain-containing protein [Lentisphaerota bacterium]
MHSLELPSDFPMIVRAAGAAGFVRVNAPFRTKVGFDDAQLAERPFLDWINPGDRELVRAVLENGKGACRARHITRDEGAFPLNIQVARQGNDLFVLGRCSEAPTRPAPAEESAANATVKTTLDMIARITEEQAPGFKCSILLVADGRFVSGAGPSLPDEYNAAIDGYAVGPTVGSCGTAIFWNVPVIVEDIQADPLWAPFAELAKKAGVAACWSHPFASRGGLVLGALALYSPVPSAPTAEQMSHLRAAARMTGLAVERGRAEEALREKRRRELELEAQLRQAAKMEAVGQLAGGVAHDFNNQLGGIMNYADLLLAKAKDEELRCYIEAIVRSCTRGKDLTGQLLAFSRMGKYQVVPVNVHETIGEVASMLGRTGDRRAAIRQLLEANPPTTIGDPTQLQNVVLNLGLNARDAMPEGGEIVFATDTIALDEDHCNKSAFDIAPGEYLRIEVRDSGTGMDQGTQTRIFEPFFTTKPIGQGTGMGLASVYGTVVNHRGALAVVYCGCRKRDLQPSLIQVERSTRRCIALLWHRSTRRC